jgi:hypothetical protein
MSDSGCKNVMFLSFFFSFFFERDGFCQLILKKNQIKKHINVCLCDRREGGREGGREREWRRDRREGSSVSHC